MASSTSYSKLCGAPITDIGALRRIYGFGTLWGIRGRVQSAGVHFPYRVITRAEEVVGLGQAGPEGLREGRRDSVGELPGLGGSSEWYAQLPQRTAGESQDTAFWDSRRSENSLQRFWANNPATRPNNPDAMSPPRTSRAASPVPVVPPAHGTEQIAGVNEPAVVPQNLGDETQSSTGQVVPPAPEGPSAQELEQRSGAMEPATAAQDLGGEARTSTSQGVPLAPEEPAAHGLEQRSSPNERAAEPHDLDEEARSSMIQDVPLGPGGPSADTPEQSPTAEQPSATRTMLSAGADEIAPSPIAGPPATTTPTWWSLYYGGPRPASPPLPPGGAFQFMPEYITPEQMAINSAAIGSRHAERQFQRWISQAPPVDTSQSGRFSDTTARLQQIELAKEERRYQDGLKNRGRGGRGSGGCRPYRGGRRGGRGGGSRGCSR